MSSKQITFKFNSLSVVFDLEPGIYTEYLTSASGKTYTAKLLRSLEATHRGNVLVLTYDIVNAYGEDKTCSLILKKHYDVIFADRADLYITDKIFEALIVANTIVYLDCKNNTGNSTHSGSPCDIDFTESEIRYYVGNF